MSDSFLRGNITPEYGGGLYNRSVATLTDVTIIGNRATAPLQSFGGGIYLENGSQTTLSFCAIGPNRCARVGGGRGIYRFGMTILSVPGTRFIFGDDIAP